MLIIPAMSAQKEYSPFNEMREAVDSSSVSDGYLWYWLERGEQDVTDERVARLLGRLTNYSIRANQFDAEAPAKSRHERVRYWYRALGPLNPLDGVLPDLITAAELTYKKEWKDPGETWKMAADNAYMLAEIGRMSAGVRGIFVPAYQNGLQVVESLIQSPQFPERMASEKMDVLRLRRDMNHDVLRIRYFGDVKPTNINLADAENIGFHASFAREEKQSIDEFLSIYNSGDLLDENFGNFFEWYFSILRRYLAWSEGKTHKTYIRSATSRENAEWRFENNPDPGSRISDNFDIFVATTDALVPEYYQLKTVKDNRQYSLAVTVIDFEHVFKTRFASLERAAGTLTTSVEDMRLQYKVFLNQYDKKD